MLASALQLIAEGGLQSMADLAGRLAVSPALLAAMLDELEQLGYLAQQAAGGRQQGEVCAGRCGVCSRAGCGVPGSARLWTLTEKGRRAVRRTAGSPG